MILHELGHCMGFRHSDYNRKISCGGNGPKWRFDEGDAAVGAEHIPGTPTDAVFDGSVMNACVHDGSTGVWTASDIVALQVMYGDGIPPADVCDHSSDNHGDGDVDCDDSDCAGDPACQGSCAPAGASCTTGSDRCSVGCPKGGPNAHTCK